MPRRVCRVYDNVLSYTGRRRYRPASAYPQILRSRARLFVSCIRAGAVQRRIYYTASGEVDDWPEASRKHSGRHIVRLDPVPDFCSRLATRSETPPGAGIIRSCRRASRIASLFSATVYGVFILIALAGAGLARVPLSPGFIWSSLRAMTALSFLGTLMNLASQSFWERAIMTPLAFVLTICFYSLARQPRCP